MAAPDVFKNATRLTWRGIAVPLLEDRASFRHENIQHPIQYRDRRLIESTGLHNWVLNATIPFRQGISKGPYKDLYPGVFQLFVAACRNRTAGVLTDPVLGEMRVKCTSLGFTATPDKRDGVDVNVEFLEAPEDIQPADDGAPKNTQELAAEGGALDEELVPVYRRWQEAPAEPTVNPLTAINSVGRQIERQGDKIAAALHDVAFRAEQIEETAKRQEDPTRSQVVRASRRLRDDSLQLAKTVREPQKRLVRITANTDAAINSVAADADMTVEAFIRLNPGFARTGRVKQGDEYRAVKEDGG